MHLLHSEELKKKQTERKKSSTTNALLPLRFEMTEDLQIYIFCFAAAAATLFFAWYCFVAGCLLDTYILLLI